jgi:hypothetical protein
MRKQPQNASTRGLRLIGQGREAEVFECRDGRVLKLLRAPGPRTGLAFEIAALDAARSAGMRVLDEIPCERPRLLQRLQKEFARGEPS